MKSALFILLSVFRAIVIPAQFEDRPFMLSRDQFRSTLDSASIYLNAQFEGKHEFVFDLAPTVSLQNDLAWYGANSTDRKDARLTDAFQEACLAVNKDVDFSRYDRVLLLAAGPCESDDAGEDYIWPQYVVLSDRGVLPLLLDGKRVDSFPVSTELRLNASQELHNSGIGPICHEFLHSFGLQDLYDTDGERSGGMAPGLWGTLSIMDRGMFNGDNSCPPCFCALEKDMLGVEEAGTLVEGSYTLMPGKGLVYASQAADESFYFESRYPVGWDRFIGTEGLMITHVDRSPAYAGYSDYYKVTLTAFERWEKNQVNCRPDRQCADLLEADPGAKDVSGVLFPQPGRDCFGSDTDPAFRFADGTVSPLALTSIKLVPGGGVSFDVIRPISLDSVLPFQESAIVSWGTSPALEIASCSFDCFDEDGKTVSYDVAPSASGRYSLTLENLLPRVNYRYLIRVTSKSGQTFSVSSQFRTKAWRKDVPPYIYLPSDGRNDDGSFPAGMRIPLKVFNAPDAVSVGWSFGGRPVTPGSDGCFLIERSGALKADVQYQGGDNLLILKEIVVR